MKTVKKSLFTGWDGALVGCVVGWPVGCDDGGPPTATNGGADAVAAGKAVYEALQAQ